MKNKLEQIKNQALEKIEAAEEAAALNDIRVAILGKKGELTSILKSMKDVAAEERPVIGQMVNETRAHIEEKLQEAKAKMDAAFLEIRLQEETIDVTLPGKRNKKGHAHPNTSVLREVEDIFIGMGYEVIDGPEVEEAEKNFTALRVDEDHPARDEQDTFYITDDIVLRTQTSPVQIREMERVRQEIHKKEQAIFKETGEHKKVDVNIRMIAPGRVFRSDAVDATHSPTFHQIEGMVIGKNITFADLKGTLTEFAKRLFGEDTKVKFRPHHFPFTEPSAEVDVTCFKCKGKGCRFCKGEGWIEILGCGSVHPEVLQVLEDPDLPPEERIDSSAYSGFAFGVGLERITLLKYEIDDMRLLYENDTRFLEQF